MKFPLNLSNVTGRAGILMPALSYRFRILFGEDENSDLNYMLTQQIVSCENNYVKKETKITIREPYNSIIHRLVLKMSKSSINIQIQEMDGMNSNVLNTVCFSGCILKNHKVKYDYGLSDPVKHILTFKAANVKTVDEYKEGDLFFEDVLVLE